MHNCHTHGCNRPSPGTAATARHAAKRDPPTTCLAKWARWGALLGPNRPPYSQCVQALVSGQLTNLLSPLRAGDAIQIGFITVRGGALAPAAATLVGIKLLDACVLLVIASSIFGVSALGAS